MGAFTLESSTIITSRGKVSTSGVTAAGSKETGSPTRCRGKARFRGAMADATLDSTKTTRKMVSASFTGRMDGSTKGCGQMENNTERASTASRKGR